MNAMTSAATLFLLTTSLALGAYADTLSKEAYNLEKTRIEADYKAGKDSCKNLAGNAKDVCIAQIKGRNDVAEADLEARMNPGAKTQYDLALAKADAEYSVAKEQCDEKGGDVKDQCQRAAKDAFESAKASAKIQLGHESD